jgi:hypothetical protein
MKPFKNLSLRENEALLRFPAYISLLAANSDGIFDETEKKAAVNFAHMKTFSCHPLLTAFYSEVEKGFGYTLEQLDKELPGEKEGREAAIKNEIMKLEKIVLKLGKIYSRTFHQSMKSFKEHIFKAHHSVIMDFVLPLPIPGLTDS